MLEPGGMSTDWAGSSMKVYPFREPYEQSLGALRDAMDSNLTASDPAKVAQVVLQLVELEKVPLKLLLGGDAIAVATAFGKVGSRVRRAEGRPFPVHRSRCRTARRGGDTPGV